jgi:hypothetical protein
MVPAELRELVAPGVPELGEPVEEEDQSPLAGSGDVKADAVDRGILVPDHRSLLGG